MRGYKAFDKDLKCRGKRYAVGEEYEEDGAPVICMHGMHFCERLVDVFDYYLFDEDRTRVCEVEALGDIARGGGHSSKCCTNRLKIIRELDWNEICKLANSGIANTGHHNSGDHNTGDYNSGLRNSGDWNSGDSNSGDWNTGDYNSGLRNSGDHNTGDYNSGDWNTGDWNTGNTNSGDHNSGLRDSGDWNTGDWNTGDSNSGSANSGDWNSGDWNSGDYNSGSRNSGNWNSGDWNATDFSSGVLCTEVPECLIFDKPSGMTLEEWRESHASHLLMMVPIDMSEWVYDFKMTDEEKTSHPEWEVTRGYLREGTYKRDFTSWWAGLDDDEKAEIFAIPNFDPDKWERITGLHVHDEMPKPKKHEKPRDERLRRVAKAMRKLLAELDDDEARLVLGELAASRADADQHWETHETTGR